jgi:uncharacterized protein (TIGR02145 family)
MRLTPSALLLSPAGHFIVRSTFHRRVAAFIARSVFILLLWGLGGGCVLFAQNGVTVSGLAINAGTVTFNVSWQTPMPVALWSDTVWVFVDYNKNGKMERLPLSPGATLTATSPGGKVIEEPDNNKGVWVAGNARAESSFSATVKLLTEIKDVAGACVYGSNYPPVGYIAANVIRFTGTAPYTVMLEGVPEPQTAGSHYIAPGAIASFTDKTGAPGRIIPGYNQPQGAGCTYTEPALVGTFANFDPSYSAATYVSLVDERDSKNYPVLKMGDRWVMARNLNYQKGLYHNTESGQANGVSFTSYDNGVPAIGSYWCPGTGKSSSSYSCEVYGALYTWETAMMLDGTGTWTEDIKANTAASAGTYNHGRTAHNGAGAGGRGICPPNWHVPTDAEWSLFLDAVEGAGSAHSDASGDDWFGVNAGTKSKAACIGSATDDAPLWTNHDSNNGTDTYGFRVLPAGGRWNDGSYFYNRGAYVAFWSSSAYSDTNACSRAFGYDQAYVAHYTRYRSYGYSVRCIRD